MKLLKKVDLDFVPTWDYARDQLEGGNSLSSQLLKLVEFEKGYFYLMLPDEADRSHLYNFTWPGLMPKGSIKEINVLGKTRKAEIINSLTPEIACFLTEEIKVDKECVCIFEDVMRSPNESNLENFRFNNILRAYDNETFYMIDSSNSSFDNVLSCMNNANVFWHFLCLVSNKSNCSEQIFKKFTLDTLTFYCKNVKFIIFAAYDGEGYIFWERKSESK